MTREHNVLPLIELLYAAAGTADGWQAFLASLRLAMSASAAHLIAHDPEARRSDVAANAGSDPEGLLLYESHWCAEDPWAYSAKISPWGGAVLVGEVLVPHAQLKRTAFYADFGRHFDIVRMIGVTLESGPASVLSVTADERRLPFDEREVSLLRALTPHMQQALRLHRRLAGAEQTAHDLTVIIDCSPRAILLLDRSGRVLFMNQAAARLAAQRDGFLVERGEIRFSSAANTARFRELVAGAIRMTSGLGCAAGGTLTIGRSSGRGRLCVFVSPLSRQRTHPAGPAAAALVSVTDPEGATVPHEASIAEAFALTPAEAKLTRLLAEGCSLTEAATRLGVRRETARTRIKTIFEKTNTHRQAELVRLVLTSVAGLS